MATRDIINVFRGGLQHDGHMNVTCLFSENRHYGQNSQAHHVSGLKPVLQREIVKHNKFTECLVLLHERLSRTMQGAAVSGSQKNDFVISCNAGVQRSVAMVSIMQAVLRKGGWKDIKTTNLHLWGCVDPWVTNACCTCWECCEPQDVPEDVVQSAYKQWRAVCC